MATERGCGRRAALYFCAAACFAAAGGGCPTDGWIDGTQLDRLGCTMSIVEENGQADVTAKITNILGLPIELSDGQAIEVNGQPLTGPDARLEYSAAIARADTYLITAIEPTRGVQDTTVEPPAAFAITSPGEGGEASLSGFTVTWSNANPDLHVVVQVLQDIFDQERTFVSEMLTDEGSFTLTAEDLGEFQQGADLNITVRRIRQMSAINGFKTGQVSVARSRTVRCVPAP